MTKPKTIRVSGDDVIWEDDRRKEQRRTGDSQAYRNRLAAFEDPCRYDTGDFDTGRRQVKHNYKDSNPKRILLIPIDPQPEGKGTLRWKPCSYTQSSRRGVVGGDVYIFTPEDGGQEKEYTAPNDGTIIVVEEKWTPPAISGAGFPLGYLNRPGKQFNCFNPAYTRPASTMPESLNSFINHGCLEVEERKSIWFNLLLVSRKEEG